MNRKRSFDASPSSCSNEKRKKYNTLTISKKVELLRKLEKGSSVMKLCEEYNVGKSTVYDLQKQKKKILSFFADSDTPLEMDKRKSTRQANNEDMDKVMIAWVRQRRSENIPLTGPMIIAQAKIFHEELQIETPCEYSLGWLDKFKKRHGIRQLRISGDKASADVDSVENFVTEFNERISEKKLSLEQIYNADETSLFWRYVPRKTLATADETNPSGVKDIKERITVLACANAAGTHKCKLMVIGKSAKPRALKGVKVLPLIYKANKRAWITKELVKEWLEDYFLKEVRAHYRSIGLDDNADIVLVFDNCSAHPNADFLKLDNIIIIFLPPNCTSLIQPLDMGVLRSLKCEYKNNFMRKMLTYINTTEKNICDFLKDYNIKDALWGIANSWSQVSTETLKNAWHNLIPSSIFFEEDLVTDFEGFRTQKRLEISDLLKYCKETAPKASVKLDESDIQEILHCDDDVPVINPVTDNEVINMALGRSENVITDDDDEEDSEKEDQKIPTSDLLNSIEYVIKGLEQRSFISEHSIMNLYMVKEQLIDHKHKSMKQLTLLDMFRK